jgi:DNA-binding XRE family transcriptional regulator
LLKKKLTAGAFYFKSKLAKNDSLAYIKGMITPAQCRAARALLDWTQSDLAAATGLSVVTIRSFEKGGEMRDSNRTLLLLSFEKAGVEFIPENGSGAGVRLRKEVKQ